MHDQPTPVPKKGNNFFFYGTGIGGGWQIGSKAKDGEMRK